MNTQIGCIAMLALSLLCPARAADAPGDLGKVVAKVNGKNILAWQVSVPMANMKLVFQKHTERAPSAEDEPTLERLQTRLQCWML